MLISERVWYGSGMATHNTKSDEARGARGAADRSQLPVNGSIRLPNGDSFRYVRSDIMRDAIAKVTYPDTRNKK